MISHLGTLRILEDESFTGPWHSPTLIDPRRNPSHFQVSSTKTLGKAPCSKSVSCVGMKIQVMFVDWTQYLGSDIHNADVNLSFGKICNSSDFMVLLWIPYVGIWWGIPGKYCETFEVIGSQLLWSPSCIGCNHRHIITILIVCLWL